MRRETREQEELRVSQRRTEGDLEILGDIKSKEVHCILPGYIYESGYKAEAYACARWE